MIVRLTDRRGSGYYARRLNSRQNQNFNRCRQDGREPPRRYSGFM